jgi:hypothetical protein
MNNKQLIRNLTFNEAYLMLRNEFDKIDAEAGNEDGSSSTDFCNKMTKIIILAKALREDVNKQRKEAGLKKVRKND